MIDEETASNNEALFNLCRDDILLPLENHKAHELDMYVAVQPFKMPKLFGASSIRVWVRDSDVALTDMSDPGHSEIRVLPEPAWAHTVAIALTWRLFLNRK